MTIWQYWLGKTKPKQAFRSTRNAFKKLLKNYLTEFFSECLPCLPALPACLSVCLPSDLCNSTMAKATGLFFHCLTSLQPERCLLPYRYAYNVFFMDLARPSFVSHSSLLSTKSVNFVVGDGFHS